MFKQEVFNEIFEENSSGEKYYIIDNGYKIWIIPDKNMKKGYGIYQVSSFRGKLIKYVLPNLKKIGFIRRIAKCQEVKLKISDDLHNVIRQYYDGDCQCSVYYGNLDNEQNYKATIQVYNEEKVLFYIKITKSEKIKEAMERELESLKELKQKNVKYIAEGIALENYNQWNYFVQAAKNIEGKTEVRFSENHWKFLECLYERTKIKCKYETTDMYKYIDYLERKLLTNSKLSEYKILNTSIEIVKEWLQENNIYSFAHGDFTPWNMYHMKNDIYVFDFEYCMKKTIPFMDYFHFICQANLIANHMNIRKTMKEYEDYKEKLERYVGDADKAFAGYLLFIISFYIMRNEDGYNTNNKPFQYRIKLLENILNEVRR